LLAAAGHRPVDRAGPGRDAVRRRAWRPGGRHRRHAAMQPASTPSEGDPVGSTRGLLPAIGRQAWLGTAARSDEIASQPTYFMLTVRLEPTITLFPFPTLFR